MLVARAAGQPLEAVLRERVLEPLGMVDTGFATPDVARLLSRAAVAAMTTDQLGDRRHDAGPSRDGSEGWGLGVGVQLRRTGPARSVGSYGWDGGLGSSWANDPAERLVVTVLTTDMFHAAWPRPAVIQDVWTGVYAALGD